MDFHKLALERSIAYHRVIAERLVQDSGILDMARHRVKEWLAQIPNRPYVRQWDKILAQDAKSVAAFLVDRGELAEELRQSSPFAGVLNPRERWRIWRETRERFVDK
jgi:hypothetical protein